MHNAINDAFEWDKHIRILPIRPPPPGARRPPRGGALAGDGSHDEEQWNEDFLMRDALHEIGHSLGTRWAFHIKSLLSGYSDEELLSLIAELPQTSRRRVKWNRESLKEFSISTAVMLFLKGTKCEEEARPMFKLCVIPNAAVSYKPLRQRSCAGLYDNPGTRLPEA
ncbi:hypothetical protein PENARI_c046G02413 [Penicillium arizonense]|uniref:Uncharacterized protein n=1 Tax=Penicillium arizonense TaxID=1835702 RepID=A0A1F5L2G5_PENAI|nr:hypothetical protein PENARI_c046G02413 [Penicillium arizonense]OGE47395.1 hypothetical protein PENARI_c046G02413 [Penicillium arizonense]